MSQGAGDGPVDGVEAPQLAVSGALMSAASRPNVRSRNGAMTMDSTTAMPLIVSSRLGRVREPSRQQEAQHHAEQRKQQNARKRRQPGGPAGAAVKKSCKERVHRDK